ncbi:MAG: phosphoribosylglycinamide formyltransferase [Vicinamibacterales bacterium]
MAISVENTPVPLAILISGRGSNMRAIGEAIGEGRLRAVIRVVVSNRADAAGLQWAREAGLETLILPHGEFGSRDGYARVLVDALQARGVKLVCLAGFMRLLSPLFFDAFPEGVLNVHPSLLPAFAGMDAQAQALAHGVKVSGVTVHFVTPELDAGPIIQQAAVPVRDDDTCETLSARILAEEHRVYPEAIQRIIDGDWRVDGRRVVSCP